MSIEPDTNLDRDTSLFIANAVQAVVKECYRNAAIALLSGAAPKQWLYVEGAALFDDLPIPFEHAWLETSDGRIIDPTIVVSHAEDNGPHTARYYAAVKYTYRRLESRALRETLPLALNNAVDRIAFRETYVETLVALGNLSDEAKSELRRMYGLEYSK